jgi:hypothetical protein
MYFLFIFFKENISHFIRGYFDGDGSIGKYNGRHKFSIMGTYEVLNWILTYFKSYGIQKIPKISKKNNIYTFQINSRSDIHKIKEILYESCDDYFLKRKKIIFEN